MVFPVAFVLVDFLVVAVLLEAVDLIGVSLFSSPDEDFFAYLRFSSGTKLSHSRFTQNDFKGPLPLGLNSVFPQAGQ